ncbi:hypothetical protein ACLIN3_27490 (plasmid) [Pseudomonas orientalis]|uniref:hypothetical protein n=1 Tax=Pseudomonas orientalis TaxID=76758 RepID=UPI00398761D4
MANFFAKDATPADKIHALFVLGGIAAMFCYMGYRIAGTSNATPLPGSAVAAEALASEYLAAIFTSVENSVIEGDTATVNAVVMDQKCVLTMKRVSEGPGRNQSGWLVKNQSCVPAK